MVGKLAVSLAGHDKGSIFLVIREDGDVIWLADGISRLYQSPKRKKSCLYTHLTLPTIYSV